MFNDTNSSISLKYLKAFIWKLYINSLFNTFLKVLFNFCILLYRNFLLSMVSLFMVLVTQNQPWCENIK